LDTRATAISVFRYGKRLVVGQRKSPEPAVSQPRCAVDHTITGDQSGTVRFGSEEEGVRRGICDMWLLIDLIFHLFLSSFTHDGVDVMIVDWNLKHCPEGKLIAWQTTRPP
jgi:hypothetical protein